MFKKILALAVVTVAVLIPGSAQADVGGPIMVGDSIKCLEVNVYDFGKSPALEVSEMLHSHLYGSPHQLNHIVEVKAYGAKKGDRVILLNKTKKNTEVVKTWKVKKATNLYRVAYVEAPEHIKLKLKLIHPLTKECGVAYATQTYKFK